MEATGKIQRLKEAKEKEENVKLIFQYPGATRATIKSGFIIEVYDDCFWIEEKFEGKVTFGYNFLEEIKVLRVGR